VTKLIKQDLAYEIRDLLGLERRTFIRASKATHIVNAILDTIVAALRRGEPVWVPGFGKFTLRTKPSRRRQCQYFYGRKHGPVLLRKLPAKVYVHFQPAKPLLRTLNKPYAT
jgi:nucleoid DNA-binding protein